MSTSPQLPLPGATAPPPPPAAPPAAPMTPETLAKRQEVRDTLKGYAARYLEAGTELKTAIATLKEWLGSVPEPYRLHDAEVDQAVCAVYNKRTEPAAPPAPPTPPAPAATPEATAQHPNPPDGMPNATSYEAPPKIKGANKATIPPELGLGYEGKVSSLRGDDVDKCHDAAKAKILEAGHAYTLAYHTELGSKRTKAGLKGDIKLMLAILEGKVPMIDGAMFKALEAGTAPPTGSTPAAPPAAPATAPLPSSSPPASEPAPEPGPLGGLDDAPPVEEVLEAPADSSHVTKHAGDPYAPRARALTLITEAANVTRTILGDAGYGPLGAAVFAEVLEELRR